MIRLATVEDIPVVFELCTAAISENPHLSGKKNDQKLYDTIYTFIMAPNEEKILLVAEQNELVGLLMGFSVEAPFMDALETYELLWWVKPEYRKTKDNLNLFRAYNYWAMKLGADCINSGSVHGWKDLSKFYKRQGFFPAETTYRKLK